MGYFRRPIPDFMVFVHASHVGRALRRSVCGVFQALMTRSNIMQIRDERPGDEERISCIEYAAFKDHPQHAPGAEPTEHLIVDTLRAAGALSLSLLAEEEGEPVGHIALSPTKVGATDTGWYLLGPVGVLPDRQRRGIGSALIREAIRRMRDQGADGIVLVGDPEFYVRFGFAGVPGLGWPGVPDQYVMALPLGGVAARGEISAHPVFGEV